MSKQLESELPLRRDGLAIEVAGHALLLHGDVVLPDGVAVHLSPAPLAVLSAMVVNPGPVVPRRDSLAAMPTGQAHSELAVELARDRLRVPTGTKGGTTGGKGG